MLSFLVEAIKLVGGIAGLATAWFVIHDNLTRGRPILRLHRRDANGNASLRVINNADEDRVVRVTSHPPGLLNVAIDDSVRGIAYAVFGDPEVMHIRPHSQAILPLVPLKEGKEHPHRSVTLRAFWGPPNSKLARLRSARLRTTVSDVMQLEQAKSVSRDADGKKV